MGAVSGFGQSGHGDVQCIRKTGSESRLSARMLGFYRAERLRPLPHLLHRHPSFMRYAQPALVIMLQQCDPGFRLLTLDGFTWLPIGFEGGNDGLRQHGSGREITGKVTKSDLGTTIGMDEQGIHDQ